MPWGSHVGSVATASVGRVTLNYDILVMIAIACLPLALRLAEELCMPIAAAVARGLTQWVDDWFNK